MCISAEALALFLNMIAGAPVTMEPGRIMIHAETRTAHWVAVEDEWCTMAPQIDRLERFAALKN
jgi:hypothetical protein